MKNTLTFLVLLLCSAVSTLDAQQFISRAGHVRFFSSTPLEDIEAETVQMSAILDAGKNGGFAFQIPILTFHFDKALMEEHFNESYLESEKHPRATFEGAILNWEELNPTGGWQDVVTSGNLNVHGVSLTRTIQGQMQFNAGSWEIRAQFDVLTADHEIRIPKMVRNQIAESITVYVDAVLTPR